MALLFLNNRAGSDILLDAEGYFYLAVAEAFDEATPVAREMIAKRVLGARLIDEQFIEVSDNSRKVGEVALLRDRLPTADDCHDA